MAVRCWGAGEQQTWSGNVASSAFGNSAVRLGNCKEPGIPTASAEALLDRMLNKIDGHCAERDRLKKEQPSPFKGKALGGRRW